MGKNFVLCLSLLAITVVCMPVSASSYLGMAFLIHRTVAASCGQVSSGCECCGHGIDSRAKGLGCCCSHSLGVRRIKEFVHMPIDTGAGTWFNCGCNGSYKFPVPPLYTYHWIGMFSHQLTTDYQSQRRFPAVRPFGDFNPSGESQRDRNRENLRTSDTDDVVHRPVSLNIQTRTSKSNRLRMSNIMQQIYE